MCHQPLENSRWTDTLIFFKRSSLHHRSQVSIVHDWGLTMGNDDHNLLSGLISVSTPGTSESLRENALLWLNSSLLINPCSIPRGSFQVQLHTQPPQGSINHTWQWSTLKDTGQESQLSVVAVHSSGIAALGHSLCCTQLSSATQRQDESPVGGHRDSPIWKALARGSQYLWICPVSWLTKLRKPTVWSPSSYL